MNVTQWRIARTYQTRREITTLALSALLDRWAGRLGLHHHQEKMGSHGRCYRCGKAMQ